MRTPRSLQPAALLGLALLVSAPPLGAAQLVYRGVLEADGQPAEGRHDIRLRAFSAAQGGLPKTAATEYPAVEVQDGQFELTLDLPGDATEAWVELDVRPAGSDRYVTLRGRTKASQALAMIGQCWSSTGDAGSNPAANFIGTTDAQPFVVRTNNASALRLEPSSVLFEGLPITANVIAGSTSNSINFGAVRGATIAGGGARSGGDDAFVGEAPNFVSDHYGSVGGGFSNVAGNQLGALTDAAFATVSGGRGNTASGLSSSVGGGDGNNAAATGSTVGGGTMNVASAPWGSVGGGVSNRAAGTQSTVAGGNTNLASGSISSVVGGQQNTASGVAASVGGGFTNCAGGDFSWAGGRRAQVRPGSASGPAGIGCENVPATGTAGDQGTFVWADSQDTPFLSSGANQFLVRADGGLFFNTSTPIANTDDVILSARENSGDADIDLRLVTRSGRSVAMYVSDISGGLFITPPNLTASANRLTISGGTVGNATLSNGGTWTNASSRSFKQGFAAVDTADVLNRLLSLPITTWEYIGSAEGLHLGPVAEDFKSAFGLAGDGKAIATVDADGVALAAIQGLNAKLEAENTALRDQARAMASTLEQLAARLARIEAQMRAPEVR